MQQDEYKSVVGLDQVHVSLVTQDDASAYIAGTPEYFAPSLEATAEPETSQETQYADNLPFDVMSSEGVTKITLTTTAIPMEMLAKYLGKVFDTASGRLFDQGGQRHTSGCYALLQIIEIKQQIQVFPIFEGEVQCSQ